MSKNWKIGLGVLAAVVVAAVAYAMQGGGLQGRLTMKTADPVQINDRLTVKLAELQPNENLGQPTFSDLIANYTFCAGSKKVAFNSFELDLNAPGGMLKSDLVTAGTDERFAPFSMKLHLYTGPNGNPISLMPGTCTTLPVKINGKTFFTSNSSSALLQISIRSIWGPGGGSPLKSDVSDTFREVYFYTHL